MLLYIKCYYIFQFQTIKISQNKLILMKKEMASIHERTFKLKVSCIYYFIDIFNVIYEIHKLFLCRNEH